MTYDHIPFPPHPEKILFVCTGNSCRSVMAEAMLKKLLSDTGLPAEVTSTGVRAIPGMKATEKTMTVLQNYAIDVTDHSARRLTPEMLEEADLLFVMQESHKNTLLDLSPESAPKIFLLGDFYPDDDGLFVSSPDIPDPIGLSEEFYSNVGEVIWKCCEMIVRKLQAQAASN